MFVTKYRFAALLIVVLGLNLGCGKHTRSTTEGNVQNGIPPIDTEDFAVALKREPRLSKAREVMQDELSKYFLIQNGSWYTLNTHDQNNVFLTEYKGFEFRSGIDPQGDYTLDPSAADRLNGVEWQCAFQIIEDASREHRGGSWSAWNEVHPSGLWTFYVWVKIVNGVWTASPLWFATDINDNFKKPARDQITF